MNSILETRVDAMEVAKMDHNRIIGGQENPQKGDKNLHENSKSNFHADTANENKLMRDVILDTGRLALASVEAISRLNRTNIEDKNAHLLLNRLVSVNNLREMHSVSIDFSSFQKEINPVDQSAFKLIGRIVEGISSIADVPLDERQWEAGSQPVLSAIRDAEYYVRNVLAIQSPSRRDLYSAVVSYTYAFWIEVGVAARQNINK